MYVAATTLGQHMTVRLGIEKSIAAVNGRLNGMSASRRLTGHIINGTDEDIDIEDIFNSTKFSFFDNFYLNLI